MLSEGKCCYVISDETSYCYPSTLCLCIAIMMHSNTGALHIDNMTKTANENEEKTRPKKVINSLLPQVENEDFNPTRVRTLLEQNKKLSLEQKELSRQLEVRRHGLVYPVL